MKSLRYTLMALMAMLLCSAFTMKEKKSEGVYLFGIAASFNDSVVYFTPIHRVDSVKLEKGFLPQRHAYSYQLKNQIEASKNKQDYTCMIYFSDTKAKLEKEAAKVKAKYVKSKTRMEEIPASEFTFTKPEEE